MFTMEPATPWLSNDTFIKLVHLGWIIDARAGGYVIGRSHSSGNIYMISVLGLNEIKFLGNMEGGEYIINHSATLIHKDRLDVINNFTECTSPINNIQLSAKTRILNAHAEPSDKFLLVDIRGQYIINKNGTNRYFADLEEINGSSNDFTNCNLFDLVPKESIINN